MKKYIAQSTVITLSFLVTLAMAPVAVAEEIVVNGNGAQSENNVSTNNDSSNHVEQSNSGTFVNEVKSTSNTGGNSASGNTDGNTTIVTGDVKTETAVSTQANTNTATVNNCCENKSSTTVVSNNGAFSENTVSQNNSNKTTVSTSNNATIVNNFKIKANTGNNSADFNTDGDVLIKTGDIHAKTIVDNGPVNVNKVKLAGSGDSKSFNSYFKIIGNGAFSENEINENSKNVTKITNDNFASILNNVDLLLNTGDNHADYNTDGDVTIVTGDIDAKTIIKNLANFNFVEIACGCEEKKLVKKEHPNKPKEEIPSQPSAPAPPTTSVGGPGPGPSSPSAPAPVTLPVTGNNFLVLLLLANIAMFFLGTYLRLRSGNSPGNTPAL